MATSALTAQNYYSTTLSSPISTTDTTISLNSLPTGSEGYLEIDEGLSTREIIYYTSKGASFVTCPSVAAGRGVGGTSASAHTSGSVVKQKVNAEYLTELQAGRTMKDSDNATVGLNPSTLYDSSDRIYDYVKPGTGVVAISSGLIGTISNVTFYQAGKRYTMTSIANKTYTASKDTYVDLLAGATTPTYTEVANNAASPALAANSVRLAIVVTSGAAITVINQGSVAATGPTISGSVLMVSDSLGNLICPMPGQTQVGYRQITANFVTAGAVATDVTGIAVPVIVPTGRSVRVTFEGNVYQTGGAGQLVTTIKEGATSLQVRVFSTPAANQLDARVASVRLTPTAGSHTYKITLTPSSGNGTVEASATELCYMAVDLV